MWALTFHDACSKNKLKRRLCPSSCKQTKSHRAISHIEIQTRHQRPLKSVFASEYLRCRRPREDKLRQTVISGDGSIEVKARRPAMDN